MNLRELKARGGLVSTLPIPKEIEWTHNDPDTGEEVTEKFTVGIVKVAFGVLERVWDAPDNHGKNATLISLTVDWAGERLSYEDAYQLDPTLAGELVKAIREVRNASKPKNSVPQTSSGVSSS